MSPALAASVQARVVLRLASAEDYPVLGVPTDVLAATSPPGRGLVGEAEVQVAVLGGSPEVAKQASAVRAFAESMRRAGVSEASPIGTLPERVDLLSLPPVVDGRLVIGIAGRTLQPLVLDPRGSFVITGPSGSGRTNALLTVVEALRRSGRQFDYHYFGTRRSPLADLDCWATRAFAADAVEAADTLAADLASRSLTSPRALVVIENLGDFANGLAEASLQEVAKVCLADDHFLVGDGEASSLGTTYGLIGYAKASRSGIALQPDQSDGSSVFRTNFPRITQSEFPPGRAMVVNFGNFEVAQIALAPSSGGRAVLPIDGPLSSP